jgi:hypothetical protein
VRNNSDKICRKNQNTFYVRWLLSENRAVYEVMQKNIVAHAPYDIITIRRMRSACWIMKATDTRLVISNTCCFATTIMASGTRLSVMVYVHCLSCFYNCIVSFHLPILGSHSPFTAATNLTFGHVNRRNGLRVHLGRWRGSNTGTVILKHKEWFLFQKYQTV